MLSAGITSSRSESFCKVLDWKCLFMGLFWVERKIESLLIQLCPVLPALSETGSYASWYALIF